MSETAEPTYQPPGFYQESKSNIPDLSESYQKELDEQVDMFGYVEIKQVRFKFIDQNATGPKRKALGQRATDIRLHQLPLSKLFAADIYLRNPFQLVSECVRTSEAQKLDIEMLAFEDFNLLVAIALYINFFRLASITHRLARVSEIFEAQKTVPLNKEEIDYRRSQLASHLGVGSHSTIFGVYPTS